MRSCILAALQHLLQGVEYSAQEEDPKMWLMEVVEFVEFVESVRALELLDKKFLLVGQRGWIG
jgi:hypothetical protein